MGRVCVLLMVAIVPITVAMVPAPRSAAADPPPVQNPLPMRIGMPENMFSGLPPGVVQAVSKPFQTMLEKQTGIKGEVQVAKDYTDMVAQLKAGKLEVAVFQGFEFAWVKQQVELVPLLVTVPENKVQACLVVNVACKAKGAHELKGASVAVPANTKAHCRLYLDRLKSTLPEGCCGTAKIDGQTVEEALDAVASQACPAALVEPAALRAYQRNKPGVGAGLKVLSESISFPSAVLVYRKDAFDAKTATKVRDGLIKCTETAQGRLLVNLWRLEGFAEVTPAYQLELDKSLKAYPESTK